MKYSQPLVGYSLSPLGYSCNIGQKPLNIHDNPCQHFWHRSSDCIFFCAKQFGCCLWLSCPVLCSTFVPFSRDAKRIEIGELLEAMPPSLPAVMSQIPAFTECVHRAEGPLSCLVLLLWPVGQTIAWSPTLPDKEQVLGLLYFFPD